MQISYKFLCASNILSHELGHEKMGDSRRFEATKWLTGVYEYYIPPMVMSYSPGVTDVPKDEESNTNELEIKYARC